MGVSRKVRVRKFKPGEDEGQISELEVHQRGFEAKTGRRAVEKGEFEEIGWDDEFGQGR